MLSTNLTPKFHWQLCSENQAERDRLARALNLHPVVAQALVNRGISEVETAKGFLKPSLQILPDPSTLPDFKPAMATLAAAIRDGAKIQIHGDYDADGICGSALLVRLFRVLGNEADVFIPDRGKDGYSLGERSLQMAESFKAEVVVTVDNGTSAIEQMEALAGRGIKTIIVDHHPLGPIRPNCAALVNPWCSPGADPSTGTGGDCFPWFCGTGVAWLLAWGLLREINGKGELPESHRRFLFDALGLAALATVADVMPLIGPNRAIVHHGLKRLKDSSFPGLAELVKSCRLRGAPTSTDLGFRLAPRINAAGRMQSADTSFRLLACSDQREAEQLAAELDALNIDRRAVEERDLKALAPQVEEQLERGDQVIFTGLAEAHVGVLGIIAARFTDSTGLPSLAWSQTSPDLARGSARSPQGVNLMDLLEAVRPLFKTCGGHARAAGFSFDPARHQEIAEALRAAAAALPAPPRPSLSIEAMAGPADLTVSAVRQLEQLEPFGEGNRQPIFCCEGATISRLQIIGQDQSHLALTLERSGSAVRVLAWRKAEELGALCEGERVDVAYTVGINTFRGKSNVEWTLKDIRPSQD